MKSKKYIDVFNGDADGLCALMQWRRCYPQAAQLLSGVKRDNALLRQIVTEPDLELLVLDINFENNRDDAARLLVAGATIRYFDHHAPGQRLEHPRLSLTVDESPLLCTSLLVHQALGGREAAWAVAGAFGDNLPQVATALATAQGFSPVQTDCLRELGELLNYNGYGTALTDLHFDPVALYGALHAAGDPFAFAAISDVFRQLKAGHADDMAAAAVVPVHASNEAAIVYLLPDQPWARRVIGVWANTLSQQDKTRAHLILCPDGSGRFTASVRAAPVRPQGAAAFCRQFPGGGGRAAAGGVNGLAENVLDTLIGRFLTEFSGN